MNRLACSTVLFGTIVYKCRGANAGRVDGTPNMAGFGGTDRWDSDSFNEMFLDPSTPLSDLLQGSNKTDNCTSATDVYTVLPDDTWGPLNISNCDAEDILTFSLNSDYYSEQLITSVSSSSPKPDATIVFSHGPATGSLSSEDMTFVESMVPSGHENWTIPSQENMADVSSQSCKIRYATRQ
jgi:hypothetical protein